MFNIGLLIILLVLVLIGLGWADIPGQVVSPALTLPLANQYRADDAGHGRRGFYRTIGE